MKCIISLAALFALGGCATFIESSPATSDANGLRYSLPAPFLMVTPKPDGTLDVVTLNLPDPDNTYTLRTKSLISSYTLDIQLDHQMLKSITMNPKSDAVAAATVDTLGNLRKSEIEARTKAEDDARKAGNDAAKALADAELAATIAKRKVEILKAANPPADPDKLLEAQLAESEAIEKRDALRRARADTGARLSSADAPAESQAGTGRMAAGAMLFRIVPDGKGVRLVAVRGPTMFATASAALATPGFSPTGTLSFTADQNGLRKLEITYSRPVAHIENAKLFDPANFTRQLPVPAVTASADSAGAKVTIILGNGTAVGSYGLSMDLILPDGSRTPALLDIVIQK